MSQSIFKMKKNVIFLLLTIQASLALSIPREYINQETLDGEGKLILRWEITGDTIEFELEAETLGFVGFGISPSGTMTDADIFIAGVKEDGTIYSRDYHGVGEISPVLDAKSDWELLSAREEVSENKTILKFSRLLNTCDDEDYPIGNDTNRIIWALGSTDTITYHGPTTRGTKSTNLIHTAAPEMDVTTLANFTVSVTTTMPALDTSYWCTFHKGPILGGKHHVVAFDTILPSLDSFQHTHHFVIYNCKVPTGSNQTEEELFDEFTYDKGVIGDHCHSTQTLPVALCQSVMYTWAKGGKMMIFPDNVGFPIGETGAIPHYHMLEIHYDNPALIEGLRFESGLAMYYTDELRPIDAGIIALGQMVDVGLTVPPMTDNFKVVGHCSPECTRSGIRPEGITVFASMQHSHKSGRKMRTRHFRGNLELPWLDFDDHYDFDFQQNKILLQPRVLLPGDQLSVECTYSSTWKNGEAVIGGYSTYEEMCQNLIWYWPSAGMSCMSSYRVEKHLADFGVETYHKVQEATGTRYHIDTPVELAGDFFDLVSYKFNWTKEFQDAYALERLNGPQISGCNGQVVETRYPEGLIEYVPEDVCNPEQVTNPTSTLVTTPTDLTPPLTTPPTVPTTTGNGDSSAGKFQGFVVLQITAVILTSLILS